MKRKITLIVGTTALCVVLLTGCGDNASTAESKDEGVDSVRMQQETAESIGTASQESTDSTATKEEKQRNAELEESARKFKSAENYQASGEYFKAYSLYQKVIEDDSNYTEAQKRAAEMLELYWKQQDDLVEQGEYQTAIENTLDVMSFLNMTSPLDNDIGLEKTILQVAEKLAKTCGYSPEGKREHPQAARDGDCSSTEQRCEVRQTKGTVSGRVESNLQGMERRSDYSNGSNGEDGNKADNFLQVGETVRAKRRLKG